MTERLVVIGESLVDVIAEPTGARTARPGGSPMNVAIGAARLGLDVTLITAIGDDEYATMVRRHILSEDVGLIDLGDPAAATNEAVAVLDASGAADYAFRLTNPIEDAAAAVPAGARHLHVGSLTAVTDLEWTGVRDAVRAAREHITVSYDPNCRPAFGVPRETYRDRVETLVAGAHIVKASDEDLAWLYPGERVDGIVSRWLGLGPDLILVTRGGDGPVAYTATTQVGLRAPNVAVADTVGAGDSFMAAVLAWCDDHGRLGTPGDVRFDIDDLRGMLDFAACAAALTCTRPGANPPDRAELEFALAS